MPIITATFDTLDGIPTHYAREPVAPYGSRGVQRTFFCAPQLLPPLTALFEEIKAGAPSGFGALEVITTAGAFVDRPGQHGLGRAMDLDGLFWKHIKLVAIEQETKTLLYLAVQALAHRHFGVVLGFNYNADHRDHLHFDISRSVRFRPQMSVTFFIQETVNAVYGEAVAAEGEWGNETASALKRVRDRLGIGPVTTTANWLLFLAQASQDAFALAEARRQLEETMPAGDPLLV